MFCVILALKNETDGTVEVKKWDLKPVFSMQRETNFSI